MSSRTHIKEILINNQTITRIIHNLPVSIDEARDITNLSIWWILNNIDKENLLRLLELKNSDSNVLQDISPEVLREYKKIWIKIIRFIDSLWTHKKTCIENWANNQIYHNMKIPWVALEYFLLDAIKRFYPQKNDFIEAEKWPSELEWKKVDFVLNLYRNLKLWIQLTLSEWSLINKKRNDVHNTREYINNTEWQKKQEKLMSSKYIPDVPILMIINSDTSRQAYHDNILLKAFEVWKQDWFPNWWPGKYLSPKIQKEL
jgi:hypothetical protein